MHFAVAHALALLLALAAPEAAVQAPPGIEADYQKIAAAFEAGSTSDLAEVLADSFEYVPFEGRPIGRADWLANWAHHFRDAGPYSAASYRFLSAAVRAGACGATVERTTFQRPPGARQESVQVCRTEDQWIRQGTRWLLRSQRELRFPDDGEVVEDHPSPQIPRLTTLRDEMHATGPRAADDFVNALRGHAPLVEPLEGDPSRRRVTYVYQGDPMVREVRVTGGPYSDRPKTFSRLAGSDLWYRTETLPADSRFVYFLTVTRPRPRTRAHGDAAGEAVVALSSSDPLNPIEFNGGSVVWPPGTPPPVPSNQRLAHLRGRLRGHKLNSAALGEERTFSVYAPAGGAAQCLLVALDGEDYTGLIPTPAILDDLTASGRLPPTAAVFVNNQGLRFRDLRCSPAFARFLATELVPWVRAEYHLVARPDRTAVAGASLGGLTAAFVAHAHPQVFGKVLSQSGAFWYHPEAGQDGWLTSRFADTDRRPVEFWMEVGAFESPAMVSNNRRLRDVLRAKGYPVRYREYDGGHDFLTWRDSLGDGLTHLLGNNGHAD